ncbi:hypothetical protein SAMD00023353_2001560 [Rosellinia necatrix]|uniref:Uncharacterized protein n=1 Tax=Rosellinia necatrix TaxID=77044 RepID=A0A1W2TEX2_ROSNE|nr:hypothetical protein SAMD00023353_2001560 [Rosellinia necatrix]
MGSSYIPPFRRHKANGGSGDTLSATCAPNNQAPQAAHHNNRAAHDGQRYRGYGRGGRAGYQKSPFQKHRPQVDQSDLYCQDDLYNHFWGNENDARDTKSSTFHDSKDRPEQLSHLLLFFGANPRWANDRIVFAKSKLVLLPEYLIKKAENGEWETKRKLCNHKTGEASTTCGGDGVPEGRNATAPPNEQGAGASVHCHVLLPGEARLSSHPPVGEDNNRIDKSCDVEHTTASTSTTDSVIGERRPHAGQEVARHKDDTPSPGMVMEAQKSHRPIESDNKELDRISLDNSAKYQEWEERRVIVRAEGPDHQAETTPIPANEFGSEHEPSSPQPVFPSVTPIDYIPASHSPIAIFEEHRIPGVRTGGAHARFAFVGWFKISRVNIIAPHSSELVHMLQQKWERRDRFGRVIPSRDRDWSAWNTSMAMEWAVVRFALLEGDSALPRPQIEKLSEPEHLVGQDVTGTKTVNQPLSEMRLDDYQKNRQKGDSIKQDEDKVALEVGLGMDHPTLTNNDDNDRQTNDLLISV